MDKILSAFAFLILFSLQLSAQEESVEEVPLKKHSFTLSIGHTHIGEGVSNGKKRSLVLPSWGFNYDFHIDDNWSIGLHNDLIIEQFEVEVEGKDNVLVTIDRSRPISIALTASYRLNKFLILSAGTGQEIAPEEAFTIFRVGVEPYVELPNNFEILGTFAIDFRVDAYNAINFALGIAKKF